MAKAAPFTPPLTASCDMPAMREPDAPPVGWSEVMIAAAARLDEGWEAPDAEAHLTDSGLTCEFAALLCAYGHAKAEIEHGRALKAHSAADACVPPADRTTPSDAQ